jgi:hypothetical protein
VLKEKFIHILPDPQSEKWDPIQFNVAHTRKKQKERQMKKEYQSHV